MVELLFIDLGFPGLRARRVVFVALCAFKVLGLKLLFTKCPKHARAQLLPLLSDLSIELQPTRLINLTHLFSFVSSHEAIYLYTDHCNHILAFSHLCESKTSFSEAYLWNFESFWFNLIELSFSSSVVNILIYFQVWFVWEIFCAVNMIKLL